MSENPKRLIGAREVAENMHIGRTKAYELIREQMVVFSSANTMESLMGIVKAECVHARTYATREEAALDLFEYIEVVYNRARTHSALATSAPPSSKRPIGPRKTAARRRRKNCQWNRGRSRFNPPHTHIVSDLTYVRVGGKWNYVCLLVDLHNREIVGHAASGRKDARLVKAAFATLGFPPADIDVLRANRGSEFANPGIDDLLEAFDIRRSLSRKGNPYDNTAVEPANRILKKELIYRRAFTDLGQLRRELNPCVRWRNEKRMHSTLGYMSPVEFRNAGLSL